MMAALGVRRIDELIGHTELLVPDDAVDHWKALAASICGRCSRPRGRPRRRRAGDRGPEPDPRRLVRRAS